MGLELGLWLKVRFRTGFRVDFGFEDFVSHLCGCLLYRCHIRAFSNEHQKVSLPPRNGSARRQGIENECMKFELNVGEYVRGA